MLKKCKHCGLEAITTNELHLFSKASSCILGRRNICKKCKNERNKVLYKPNKVRMRKNTYKALYNITIEDYDILYLKQQGCCAICKIHSSILSKSLYVDHCHKTGKVRGLLCQHCNSMLGFSKDNTEVLWTAIQYINNN